MASTKSHRIRLKFLFLFTIAIFGCKQKGVKVTETVNDTGGSERLALKKWEVTHYTEPDVTEYYAHSLVWQVFKGGSWKDFKTIKQADFQRGSIHERWISHLHSFDAKSGTAVLKIGEADAPPNAAHISIIYSWRKWDLKSNAELEMIRVCSGPFEPFEISPENQSQK
jgi:hypothetical protein